MLSASDTRFVTLRGGPTVPVEPLILFLDLEARGFRLVQEDDTLVVTPRTKLTRTDCDALRRWKHHLLALLDYSPPEVG